MRDCADQPPGLGFRISSDFQRSHSRNDHAINRPETRCSIEGKQPSAVLGAELNCPVTLSNESPCSPARCHLLGPKARGPSLD